MGVLQSVVYFYCRGGSFSYGATLTSQLMQIIPQPRPFAFSVLYQGVTPDGFSVTAQEIVPLGPHDMMKAYLDHPIMLS